ncbi:MAG: elongation factor Ts [Candidatus Omnitrophica bacterium]|nr:elongation factor Ts [Candidatus Omnitrophota bacterium]MBU1871764.1 elongation factor Ts [Candidatus Omnitrophota bacterium]
MKKISLDLIKDLRSRSQASISDCRKALEESKGDMEAAMKFLRKRGLEIALSKKSRCAKQGRVECYVHQGNKLGVIVEVNSETDFVARNEEFCQFTKDLAMQIAASCPIYIAREDVPKGTIDKGEDKEEFYKRHCLLEQAFIKDPSINISDYLNALIGKIGENIVVRRFTRYKIGEE